MKTSHTPGPWHVAESPNHHSPFITNVTGKGTIANSVHGATSQEQEANARLIAAAPELLEALQAIVTDHDAETGRYMAKELRAHTWERLMNDARAAIAKATQP